MGDSQPHTAVHAAVVALAEAASSATDLGALSNHEVVDVLGEVAHAARLAESMLVSLAGEVTERSEGVAAEDSLARQAGAPKAKTLLARATGRRVGQIARLQSLAAKTRTTVSLTGATVAAGFPIVSSALTAGHVSFEQAESIVSNLSEAAPRCHPEQLSVAEHELVAAAAGDATGSAAPLTAEDTARVARAWRDALDPDGPEPSFEAQQAMRSLRMTQRTDGMWAGSFLLPADDGAAVRIALDAHNHPSTKPRLRTAEEARAEAASDATSIDDRTTAQRQADTLVGLVARGIECADAPRIGGAAPTLTVTVTKADLERHAAGEPAAATIEHSADLVPAHVAATMLCDAKVLPALVDDDGAVLALGRAQRLFSSSIRKAVVLRDGRCLGCGAPPGYCQVHHVVWWSRGGPTDLDNGILVCDWCHDEIHRGNLTVQADGDRWAVVPAIPSRSRFGFAA